MIQGDEKAGPAPARTRGFGGLAAVALAALWAGACGASPIGASSSSAVRIRLSVAPRMELHAVPAANGPDGPAYCLRSNSGPAPLPVYLVWTDREPSVPRPAGGGRGIGQSAAIELSACDGGPGAAAAGGGRRQAGMALIRPE